MRSWKTTLFGALGLVAAVLPQITPSLPPKAQSICMSISGILMGLGLGAAKDSNVTGK